LAHLLLPVFQEELEHERQAGLIRRSWDPKLRVICGQYP
jgi:hypothetical protein